MTTDPAKNFKGNKTELPESEFTPAMTKPAMIHFFHNTIRIPIQLPQYDTLHDITTCVLLMGSEVCTADKPS